MRPFPGESESALTVRDGLTLVLWGCGRESGQKHVARAFAFIFKRLRRAGMQEEGESWVPGFHGNHKHARPKFAWEVAVISLQSDLRGNGKRKWSQQS